MLEFSQTSVTKTGSFEAQASNRVRGNHSNKEGRTKISAFLNSIIN
jgi:hypothetical protein